MRAGIVVNITPEDRRRLEAIVSDRSAPQKHVWRAKIILATADGCGTAEIMRRSGKSKPVVAMGLVPSLNRPGGNATGVSFQTVELVAKQFEVLRELAPGAM